MREPGLSINSIVSYRLCVLYDVFSAVGGAGELDK